MSDTFLFLQKLLKETAGISLSPIAGNMSSVTKFLEHRLGMLFPLFWGKDGFRLPEQRDVLHQWMLPGGVVFVLYFGGKDDGYCFGPVLTRRLSQEEIVLTFSHYGLHAQENAEILAVLNQLPVVQPHILHAAAKLVVGHLTGKEQDLHINTVNAPPLNPPEKEDIFPIGSDIVQMRQVETRYEYSAALTDAVRQGNLSLALHLIGRYDPGTQTAVRNTNPLRNAQNYCIVLNTQLRHTLEQSGIHPYSVDRLSNQIGMEIEQLKSTRQLGDFFQSVLRRYCRLVQEHTYPQLKPLTHLAVTYIKEHLADNLTVKDTAEVLTVNANYLSGLFHQDMGMTFIDFVNRERTKQAAALLRHTNLQIQQIASAVGYNNTSYFAKQFLRFHGVTPSHYRRG